MSFRFDRPIWLGAATLAMASLAAFAVGPVAAHHAEPDHYVGACADGSVRTPPTGEPWDIKHIARGPLSVGYSDARATFIVSDLLPCSNGTSTKPGWSMVWVTMQGSTLSSGSNLAQIGIAKEDNNYSACAPAGDLQNDVLNFVWTPENDGNVCRASWYDPNDNGVPNNPLIGHEYRMTVYAYGNFWRYCIQDMTEGTSYPELQCAFGAGSREGYATKAWWGYEWYNSASAPGSTANDSTPFQIYKPRYIRADDTAWIFTQNSSCSSIYTGSAWVTCDAVAALDPPGEVFYTTTELHD